LLPGLDNNYFTQSVALMHNDCGAFQNFWVTLRFEKQSPCVFTRNLDLMPLPIRHGEGKVFTLDHALLARIEQLGCVPCRYADPATGAATDKYPLNPNGSLNAIAGLCDPTGPRVRFDAASGSLSLPGKSPAVGSAEAAR